MHLNISLNANNNEAKSCFDRISKEIENEFPELIERTLLILFIIIRPVDFFAVETSLVKCFNFILRNNQFYIPDMELNLFIQSSEK